MNWKVVNEIFFEYWFITFPIIYMVFSFSLERILQYYDFMVNKEKLLKIERGILNQSDGKLIDLEKTKIKKEVSILKKELTRVAIKQKKDIGEKKYSRLKNIFKIP